MINLISNVPHPALPLHIFLSVSELHRSSHFRDQCRLGQASLRSGPPPSSLEMKPRQVRSDDLPLQICPSPSPPSSLNLRSSSCSEGAKTSRQGEGLRGRAGEAKVLGRTWSLSLEISIFHTNPRGLHTNPQQKPTGQ